MQSPEPLPSNFILDYTYDIGWVIESFPAIGESAVRSTLERSPWITDYLRPPCGTLSREGYVDADCVFGRLMIVVALLGTSNVYDLASALRVPTILVRLCLLVLEVSRWRTSILPALTQSVLDPASFKDTIDLVCDFVGGLQLEIDWFDLMRAVGPEVIDLRPSVRPS